MCHELPSLMGGQVCHVKSHSSCLCHMYTLFFPCLLFYYFLFLLFLFIIFVYENNCVFTKISVYIPGLSVQSLCSKLCQILFVYGSSDTYNQSYAWQPLVVCSDRKMDISVGMIWGGVGVTWVEVWANRRCCRKFHWTGPWEMQCQVGKCRRKRLWKGPCRKVAGKMLEREWGQKETGRIKKKWVKKVIHCGVVGVEKDQ